VYEPAWHTGLGFRVANVEPGAHAFDLRRDVGFPDVGVTSLSFWGGVWGIIFVLIEPYLVRSPGGYWVGAIIFGAIFPTAVAWFIVRPLKGLPVADVFRVPGIFIGPIVNGLWGLGTALFLSWMPGSAAPAR
jgi:hypothetical protein